MRPSVVAQKSFKKDLPLLKIRQTGVIGFFAPFQG